jgi:pimeloyl-ACP methyl ester carboxylesterase
VNASSEWIEVGGLRIHCLMAGQTGSTVLLLHGGGYDSASLSYGPSIGPISRSHRVFVPDWPGYGESDKPDLDYTTEYYVTFLGRLMDALGLEKATLVGISMGGAISLGFSLRSPERVQKLVLVDSHGLGKEVPGRVASYAMVRSPLNRLVWAAMGRSRRMVKWSLRTVFHDPSP